MEELVGLYTVGLYFSLKLSYLENKITSFTVLSAKTGDSCPLK